MSSGVKGCLPSCVHMSACMSMLDQQRYSYATRIARLPEFLMSCAPSQLLSVPLGRRAVARPRARLTARSCS
jgi:hypothetical protein